MKRSLVLLLLLPLLGSCTVQEDYYSNDYYQAPLTTARVNGPYNSFNHFTRRQRSVVPYNYHSHGNANVTRNDRLHGHQSGRTNNIHQHDDNQDTNNHGHSDEWNNRSHGHD